MNCQTETKSTIFQAENTKAVSSHVFSQRTLFPMRNLAFLAFIFTTFFAQAQVVGGRAMFEFLNIPANAELAGLGGQNVTSISRDPTMFLANPALLNKTMDKVASFSYLPYVSSIKMYSLASALDVKKIGPIAVGFKYMNYGELVERANDATYLGTFNSNEYVFTLGKSYTIGTITLGANAKLMGSQLASYKSNAWAVDAGALFKHPEHDLTIGMVVKNLGRVYKSYTPTSNDTLPFNVQIGASYKFDHAPIRLSLTAHTVNRWDIVYNDPAFNSKVDENGKTVTKAYTNFERLLRHLIFAMEIKPANFLNLQFGYNYLMSRELSITDAISSAGVSFGGNIRWDRFQLGYTHTIMHQSGGMNVLTLNIDMGTGFRREN